MGSVWHALIKCIFHIFMEKSHSKFPFEPLNEDSEKTKNHKYLST